MTGKLNEVKLITPNVFEDHRGQFVELWSENKSDIKFVEDSVSISSKNVLRGIHGSLNSWKMVSCLYGTLYAVVVNCKNDSDSFGRWESFTLSDKNRYQILIPPMYGNSYIVMSECAVTHYKQSEYFNPDNRFVYAWNDPKFNIWWPVADPILSRGDDHV